MKKICKYCNEELEFEKPQQFGCHLTNCKLNPKHDEIARKQSESKKVERISYKFNCSFCNDEYVIVMTEAEYKKNRYNICCSKKCAAKKSHIGINYNKTKIAKCVECGLIIEIKINSSNKNCKCDLCGNFLSNNNLRFKKAKNGLIKNKKVVDRKVLCKICGQENCENKICKSWMSGRSKIFVKLGFDLNKIGSLIFYKEYDRIIDILKEEYKNNSLVEIGEKFGINYQTVYMIFKSIGIKSRNNSESGLLAFKKGRYPMPEVNIYPFKSGYHNSWDGKKFWYRSSYELDFCKELDVHKIKYEMEKLRIQYFDTILNCERTSVPDFYLMDTNEIVEIKSCWTYDIQNMRDKVKSYRDNGYNFRLILDGVEKEI